MTAARVNCSCSYTNAGSVLIALNPYRPLVTRGGASIYHKSIMRDYRTRPYVGKLDPTTGGVVGRSQLSVEARFRGGLRRGSFINAHTKRHDVQILPPHVFATANNACVLYFERLHAWLWRCGVLAWRGAHKCYWV